MPKTKKTAMDLIDPQTLRPRDLIKFTYRDQAQTRLMLYLGAQDEGDLVYLYGPRKALKKTKWGIYAFHLGEMKILARTERPNFELPEEWYILWKSSENVAVRRKGGTFAFPAEKATSGVGPPKWKLAGDFLK